MTDAIVAGAGEAAATAGDRAVVGPEAGVAALMGGQIRAAVEGSAALLASVILVAGMQFLMPPEIPFLCD